MNSDNSGQSHRINDIDALRALAISMVIIWHYRTIPNGPSLLPPSLDRWLGLGVGVDLFFVISGYVIARTLIPSLDSATGLKGQLTTVYRFWLRRAFRLFPSVWLWLFLILVFTLTFQSSHIWQSLETNIDTSLSVLFYYANYRFATQFGVAPLGAGFPYWSLSLEEQFYLLLPLVFVAARTRQAFVLILLVIIASQIAQDRGILGIMFRSEGLAAGVLLAMAQPGQRYRTIASKVVRRGSVTSLIVLSLIALLCISPSAGFQSTVDLSPSRTFNLAALFSTLLVFIASQDQNTITPSGRIGRIILWIGARSYAMYLCHIPALYLAMEFTQHVFNLDEPKTGHLVTIAMAVPLTLIFSNWNYRFVELPLIAVGRRLAQRYEDKQRLQSN